MSMNCFEFHQRFAADPADRDSEILRHCANCPPCAAFARRVTQLDRSLRSVIAVDPPRELCARILLRQTCAERKSAHARRAWWLALAAGILVVVGLVGNHGTFRQDNALPRAVLAHVEAEPLALSARTPMDVAQVNEVTQAVKTRIDGTLGPISFARICQMGDSHGVHLVTRGDKGPITVLVMPNATVNERVTIRDDRYEGVIVPRAGGSIAIVGEHGESLDAAEARVQASVHTL